MTFSIIVPNAGESPALFPAQANDNWRRVQANITNEHNFLNTSDPAEGIHKQCTMINRAQPGSVTVGNGILYSKDNELNWFNGINVKITPGVQLLTGSSSLSPSTSATIFPDPGYAYQATVWLAQDGVAGVVGGGTAVHFSNNVNTVNPAQLNLQPLTYSANDLVLTNARTTAPIITFVWTIQVNRLS